MEYVVLLYGNETTWEQADADTRTKAFADHTEFSRVLAARGHTITGGAELRSTRTAMTVRGTAASVTVTDGPFAETAEQLGGFYVVETDDLDDLTKLVGIISGGDPVEIRPCVPSEEQQ
ncbi:MAG: YciI family protein [Actinomycetota bacterium]|nr:YciI family protein [Actinomycetota bacterium]